MGGRGAGVSIIGQVRGRDARKAEWIKAYADLNRAASGRNTSLKDTLVDFADASREKYQGEVAVLGIVDDQGFVLGALKGDGGCVKYNAEQRRKMSGHNVTLYQNRIVPSDALKKEIASDTEQYKGVDRALKSYNQGLERFAEADEEYEELSKALKKSPGNKTLIERRAEADKKRTLALRQIERARNTFQLRADAYDRNGAKPDRIPKRFSKSSEIAVPARNIDTRDETGYIGGCFSGADLSSDLVAKDIPSFHRCGDEGDYEVRPLKRATQGDLDRARSQIQELWREPSKPENAKKELSPNAYKFQRHLRGIDIKTNEEGRQKGWSMQKRRAISFNRQMAYAWETQKSIMEKHNIAATFTPNPKYKPVFTED